MGRSGRRSFLRRCVGQVLCGLLLLQSSPAFTDPGTGRERQRWVHGTAFEQPSGSAPSFAPEPGPAAPTPAVHTAALALAEPPSRPVRSAAASQPSAFPRDGSGPAQPEEKSPEQAAPEKTQPAPADSSHPPLPPGVKDLRSGHSLVPAALNVKAGSTSAVPLQAGWNLVSLPRQAGDPAPASVFAGAASRVFAYDACDTADPWKVWDPSNPSGNDLTAVTPQMGLWAEVPAALVLPVAGSEPATTTIHLCPGWNLIGAPFSQSRSVAGALAPIAGKYTRVFGFDPADPSDPWEVFDVSVPSWADTLQTFEPGKGYWLFAMAAADLVLANQATGPVVQIASPVDLAEVTTLTPVTGTVTGDLLRSWTLAYRAVGDTQWTSIGSGTGPVTSATLGTFDPTLLLNGPYQIQLTATDANNLEQSVQIDVNVEGQQKIGNFTLTYSDLEVPLSGLPIQIQRTYDSRDKRQGDFGVGWTLEIHQGSYKNNRQPGEGWQFASGFVPCQFIRESLGHQTTIRLSDREIYRFKLSLSRGVPTQGGCFAQAGFDFVDGPVPGATLAILGGTQVLYQNGGGEVVDPGTFEVYEPRSVRLTTRDGRIFDLTLQQGVTRLQDPNGNQLSITANGITHSSGRAVTFDRDGQGHITKITDPEGNSLTYTYDAAGNLITVADRLQQATQFTYDPTHLLLDIQDARGVTPIRNEYDANGRLLRTTDAFGKVIELNHDLANRREVVTDRLGHSRVLEYDVRGNVIRETDALGKMTSRTFDDHDQLLTETNPLNQTTGYTYDSGGNLISVRDPLGHAKSYTYNARGQALTATDARGKTIQSTYDAAGNLIQTKDPLGRITSSSYDNHGNVLAQTDARGAVTTYAYDGYGNQIQQTDALGTVTSYSYDGSGNRLREATARTQPDGSKATLVTTFGYDKLNRLTSTTRPDGSLTTTSYDAIGQVAETVDPLGRHASFTYDDLGRQTAAHDPDGTAETRVYDAEGRLTAKTDRAGHATTYSYDALGRLLTTVFADNTSTTNTYDDAGRLVATADARNNRTTYIYDAAGRKMRMVNALSGQTDFQYDEAGNQVSVTDANRRTTGFIYDDVGRLIRTVFPDSTSRTLEYDEVGRRVAETDQAGKTTHFGYDGLGRLLAVTDALNQVTRYTYDEIGSRVAQADANGHTTRFEYDPVGRMTRRVLPDGAAEVLGYDQAGNLTAKTDFAGRTIRFAYDLANRLRQKTYPDGTSIAFTYTANGRRATMADTRGTTSYAYDARDRLVEMTYPDGRKLAYAWDANGNRSQLTAYVAGQVLSTQYTYDVLNRLNTVTDPSGKVYGHGYDANSNRTSLTFPNGVQTTYTYDALNRLTELRAQTSVGAVVQGYVYTLGAAGNRIKIEEQDGTVRGYGYDALYRLTNEMVTPNGTPIYSKAFGYDPAGNRLQQVHTDAAGTVTTTNATYDPRDRQLTRGAQAWTWDANGNLTSKADEATYAWSFDDRLQSVTLSDGTVVTHTYDADGVRVRTETRKPDGTTATIDYLVDVSGALSQVVAETTGSALAAYYVRGNDLLAVIRPEAGAATWTSRYYHADGSGSIRALTDDTGAVTDRWSFTAFGELLSHTGEDANAYLFAGEQLDPNSGFYYNRARWMDPGVGRFASTDPYAGRAFDPITLHKYLYCGSNTANCTDPRGLESFIDLKAAMATLSTLISTAFLNFQNQIWSAAYTFRNIAAWRWTGQLLDEASMWSSSEGVELEAELEAGLVNSQGRLDIVLRTLDRVKTVAIEAKNWNLDALARMPDALQAQRIQQLLAQAGRFVAPGEIAAGDAELIYAFAKAPTTSAGLQLFQRILFELNSISIERVSVGTQEFVAQLAEVMGL
jgi:RHS repeat-associated protein